MNDLTKTKELLAEGGYTCVLCKDDEVYTSEFRGVRPLVAWHESDMDFRGFSAADKVVGKGAAFLYLLLGVTAVYASVISRSALELLNRNGILVEYGLLAENIINRKGDGICPFEAAVLDIDDKEKAYIAIKQKMLEMGIKP